MYIKSVPNRNSPPAILLRESFRDGTKIKKRTIANLSDWPAELVEGLRTLLKGGTATPADRESIIVRRALPHGHVAAVLGTLRAIGLDRVLGPAGNRPRDLVIAMIVARLIAPASKLATARTLDQATAASSLGDVLGLGAVDEDELYAAIDWLGERQGAIETALARKHLRNGTLVLYDVSSSYFEGRCCELARLGHNRDGKKGKLQIVYGLMCAPDGCPIAIEVFEGDTGDPCTLAAQIDKIKTRFALKHVVLVGDRGMITQARIDADIAPAGHQGARRGWGLADVVVRRARHRGHYVARLSGRAPHRLPQSRSRPRAHPQAPGSAGRDRRPSRRHRGRGSAYPQTAARRGRDCPQGRRRRQPAQDGQALRTRHRRGELLIPSQRRRNRGRGRPRR